VIEPTVLSEALYDLKNAIAASIVAERMLQCKTGLRKAEQFQDGQR
jgi:hypothetical protein